MPTKSLVSNPVYGVTPERKSSKYNKINDATASKDILIEIPTGTEESKEPENILTSPKVFISKSKDRITKFIQTKKKHLEENHPRTFKAILFLNAMIGVGLYFSDIITDIQLMFNFQKFGKNIFYILNCIYLLIVNCYFEIRSRLVDGFYACVYCFTLPFGNLWCWILLEEI